jgi:methionyl-tRNA formyltransferase
MQEIYTAGGQLDLVVTLRDQIATNKSGRVYVDSFCSERGVNLLKVRHVNDPEVIEAIRSSAIDWLFIIGWSQIAGPAVLSAARHGVLGMHPTLLPQGRGRAPIPWALIKGLDRTGVTLFKLDEGVDTGPILAQEFVPITSYDDATSLYARVDEAHRSLIRRIWADLVADRLQPIAQDESQASVWPARKPEDGRITPDMTMADVDRLVRGCTRPYPGAFHDVGTVRRIIWQGRPAKAGESPEAVQGTWLECADGGYIATSTELVSQGKQ